MDSFWRLVAVVHKACVAIMFDQQIDVSVSITRCVFKKNKVHLLTVDRDAVRKPVWKDV